MHIDIDIVDDIVVHLGAFSSRCLVRLGVMRLIPFKCRLVSLMATRSRGRQANQRTNSLTPLVSNGGGIHFSRAALGVLKDGCILESIPRLLNVLRPALNQCHSPDPTKTRMRLRYAHTLDATTPAVRYNI